MKDNPLTNQILKKPYVPEEHYMVAGYREETEFTKFIKLNYNLFWDEYNENNVFFSDRRGKDSYDVVLYNTKMGNKILIECKVRNYSLFQFHPYCFQLKEKYLKMDIDKRLIQLNKYKSCSENMMRGYLIEQKKYNRMMTYPADERLYMNFFECGFCTIDNLNQINYSWVVDNYQSNNYTKQNNTVDKIVHYITPTNENTFKYLFK